MSYSVFTDHPETTYRREQDFTAWNTWAAKHAPWTGAGVDEIAALIGRLCPQGGTSSLCATLDSGGKLTFAETRRILRECQDVMSADLVQVFGFAVGAERGVQVVYTPSAFGGLNASAWLAKFGSTSEA